MQKIVEAIGIPDEKGVFEGLAQAPLHFHNAIGELIDNAIAAKSKGFNIYVDISETENQGVYKITIIDDCGGISLEELKNRVFRLGKRPPPNAHHLREHGYGLKNVLAKIQAEGGVWEIWTCDKEALRNKRCYRVRSPLRFKLPVEILPLTEWPEKQPPKNGGTIIKFTTSLLYLQTLTKGRPGGPPSRVGALMDYLREHLGVFYRGYLEGKPPAGYIYTSLNSRKPEPVEPIEPVYSEYNKRRLTVRTKRGNIDLQVTYGKINKESPQTKARKYYYRATTDSLGVDFRIGDRVIATRLFSEIWGKARHTQYSTWCGELKIDPRPRLVPRTLNNKTSIDYDDEIWMEIVNTVKDQIRPPRWSPSPEEAELREQLATNLRATATSSEHVQSPFPCFGGAGVSVDIVHQKANELIIYETKAGKAQPLDVYQLKMYWDGMVEDGKQPTLGRLVARNWSVGVERVVRVVNQLKDKNGKNYNFELKRWTEFGLY